MRLLKIIKNASISANRTSTASTPSVPPSEAYSLLANERRRLIIAFLAEMDQESTDAGEIADYLSSIGDDRTSAYVSCIQQQLPKLSQTGLIRYDTRSKSVHPLAPLDAVYEAHRAVERTLD